MNRVLAVLSVLLALAIASPCWSQEPEALQPLKKNVVLFDGQDLNQWLFFTKNDKMAMSEVWTIRDGVLKCTGKPSGYLQTKRWFRDYELNLKWRWSGDKGGNSGVLVHTTTPLLFFGWPKSMEVQLQAGSAGDFWVIGKGVDIRVEDEENRRAKPVTGNQHSHRRIRRLLAPKSGFEKTIGQWNEMKVQCRGNQITVFVNGKLANRGTEMTVRQGAIALQSEGTPVEFKDISLKPLINQVANPTGNQ